MILESVFEHVTRFFVGNEVAADGGVEPHKNFDYKRYERAMLESPFVERSDSSRLYEVESSSGEDFYEVDIVSGNCTCEDARWNNDIVCKHAICAVLALFYSGDELTLFASSVVAGIRRDACVFDHDECEGPTGPNEMPCARCLSAFDVSARRGWDMTVGRGSAVAR